jgi:phosphohistidine phosphatase SixA
VTQSSLLSAREALMLRAVLLGLICAVGVPANALAQGAVFVVRHAERADTTTATPPKMATDPDLSQAGRARADSLAAMLKDAGVNAIFVTEFKRTQQTAAPLATALGLAPVIVPAKDTAGLVARLKQDGATALVVGHSNTVPEIVAALGVATAVTVADDEYDNLFIVTRGAVPRAIHLRYR